MKNTKSDQKARNEMNKMLYRHYFNDDTDQISESRLCEMLEKLEVSDFDQVYEKLTPEEKEDF